MLVLLFGSFTATSAGSSPKTPEVIYLWPKDSHSTAPAEQEIPDHRGNVVRITNVTRPSLTIFPSFSKSISPRPAVLVCPGGGYKYLAYNIEGTEIAHWLNSIGITAAVLKYRVPDNRAGAFADGQRAIRIIRKHSADWNIDPHRVGVIGFSAGGHLTARLSSGFDEEGYQAVDNADSLNARPDFAMLIYPAYVADEQYKLADEIKVTSQTTAAFVIQTQDDKHYFPSSLGYEAALQQIGVPCELHIFAKGGHGYGLRPSKNPVSAWPRLCENWMQHSEIINSSRDVTVK
jgi:acetyl esterase/lipase